MGVGCGCGSVCDTTELWRGATGLRACAVRVYVCAYAGAAEYLYIYIHNCCIYRPPHIGETAARQSACEARPWRPLAGTPCSTDGLFTHKTSTQQKHEKHNKARTDRDGLTYPIFKFCSDRIDLLISWGAIIGGFQR